MTVEEKVYSVLAAASAVTTLVPASRIRVPGAWQNITAPYIIHFPAAMEPVKTYENLGGSSLRMFDYYQVSIFAETYASGRIIANAVLLALCGKRGKFQFQAAGGAVYLGRDDRAELEHFAANFAVIGHED